MSPLKDRPGPRRLPNFTVLQLIPHTLAEPYKDNGIVIQQCRPGSALQGSNRQIITIKDVPVCLYRCVPWVRGLDIQRGISKA